MVSINLEGIKYDSETGLFEGCPSYRMASGYITLTIEKKKHYAHRIAWLIATGESLLEIDEIDHINGNRSDNRIANLRRVPRWLNLRNRPAFKSSKTGAKCIFELKNGSYRVELRHNGGYLFRKQYPTLAEAIKGRDLAMLHVNYPMDRLYVD